METVGECHGSDPCGADLQAAFERGTVTAEFCLPSCVQVMSLSVSSSRPCSFLYDALAAIREDDILVRAPLGGPRFYGNVRDALTSRGIGSER